MKHSALIRGGILALGSVAVLSACAPATPPTATPPSDATSSAQAAMSSTQTSASSSVFVNKLSNADLLTSLRSGGYVIYIRHGKTDKASADQLKPVLSDCTTQKTLSDDGKKQAAAIGKAFTDLKIPVGQVYASEFCRAWQTAQIAFGRYEKKSALDTMPLATADQVAAIRQEVLPFLTTVPAARMNTVLVSHDDVFMDTTGVYPATPGMAFIVKPDGKGSYDIVASVLAEDWAKLPQ